MIDEIQAYSPGKVRTKTKKIDHRLLQIFVVARREGILLLEAANRLVESRIREIHKVKLLYLSR